MPKLSCIVKNCPGVIQTPENKIKLFRFPQNQHELLWKWQNNLSLQNEEINTSSRVCVRHFDPSCLGSRKLKQGSVPTLCLVLPILSIVLVTLRSQLVSAEPCSNLRQANSTFTPKCEGRDVFVNWPDYQNASSFYRCNGIENPQLMSCPSEKYFCYVLQKCVDCSNYIPPLNCESLPTETSHDCTPINGGTPSPGGSTGATLPTPRYPTSTATTSSTKTSTTKSTTKTTITTPSSNSTKTTEPSIDPTPPTIGDSTTPPPNSTDIPPPPSPSTQNTLIPLPPTPPPTPPNVSVQPPYVSPKPGS